MDKTGEKKRIYNIMILGILPAIRVNLKIESSRLLNLRVPKFKVDFVGEPVSYSILNTPAELDSAISDLEESLKLLITLAETEKKMSLLALKLLRLRIILTFNLSRRK